jgi:enoyl-CoA hydratase/carnithine racemase
MPGETALQTPVQFDEIPCQGGFRIGVATLTREKPLNSLLLETIDLLSEQFSRWMADAHIVCMVLQSSSDRAFCAGADIQALYHTIKAVDGGENPDAQAFFRHEYELDYNIHRCDKPILAWGHGLVIGGGLGLLGGCSHRVGTPETRIAMPEITIGLFPDAGGTWYLSRLRSRLGYFLGLTGCQISAGDALDLGILNQVISNDRKDELVSGLGDLDWTSDSAANRQLLTAHLSPHSITQGDLPGSLLAFEQEIVSLLDASLASDSFFDTFTSTLDQLPDDAWLHQAADNFRQGSPTTACIFMEQMRRADQLSLAEIYKMELLIAYQCLRHPDFPEGVRALLIDKDKNPTWQYPDCVSVPDQLVMAHFEPSWQGDHPLDQLER